MGEVRALAKQHAESVAAGEQSPAEAQVNLNRALSEYKGWSEQAAARFKALHHPKRPASGPKIKGASKELLAKRPRFQH